MERSLLQQLTTHQLDTYLQEVDQAIEMHVRWLSYINRVLICRTPANGNDLAQQPHLLCNFGRWYQSVESDELRTLPEFVALDEIHREAHAAARDLLLCSHNQLPIATERYDHFVALTGALRERALQLRNMLRHDQGLASRLMLKVFENTGEGVVITDPRSYILSINDAFTRVTGYSADEVVGQRPSLLCSGRQDDAFYKRMWTQLSESGHWEGEIWNRRKNGEVYLEWLSIAAVNDAEGNVSHFVGIFSDITQAKENEQQLLRLAHFDQLTQLPNRTLFQDRLRQALALAKREQQQLAVMFLDLDGFKAVNDSLGHDAGDELLRQVAKRLQNGVRESDTVARFGGDEFTVVLVDIRDRDAAQQLAAKLVESVARPYLLRGVTVHVTTSIGISLYPQQAGDGEELLHQADAAMYHAKSHGKNHYEFFSPTLDRAG